jgi:NhaP-type Na+/H+ or K+/H+ antiporter
VIKLRARHEESESLDDFLAMGLIGLSYGLAVLAHAYGFLAVFAAGLALRRRERWESQGLRVETDSQESSARTDTVSGRMAHAVLDFNEHIERFGELIVVCLVGSMLLPTMLLSQYWLLALSLFLFFRPLSVLLGLPSGERNHRGLLAWFGVRGVGSLYYLAFAIEKGISSDLALKLTAAVFTVIVASAILHGLSAAPLMRWHAKMSASGKNGTERRIAK